MPIRSPRILKLLLATTALFAFPASAHAVSQAPPKPVVGTGTIRVPQLARPGGAEPGTRP